MTEKDNKEENKILQKFWSDIFRLNKMLLNYVQEIEEAKEEYLYHKSNYNEVEATKHIQKIQVLQPKIAILAMRMRNVDAKIMHLNPNFRQN